MYVLETAQAHTDCRPSYSTYCTTVAENPLPGRYETISTGPRGFRLEAVVSTCADVGLRSASSCRHS